MSFTRLKINNFGLIGNFESDFDNLGLVLIQGSNPESQVADSNDAGKTTLFEALLWGVWGKTIKGGQYKGKKIINWQADSAYVGVNFLGTDNKEYSIVRTEHRKDANLNKLRLLRGDTDLTQISKAETQALIDQLLGIDFLTFTHTIIFGQHQVERFASLTDAATKGIFSKILDFEHYDLALAETKRRITATQSELDGISREVMSLQTQIQRGQEFLEEAKQKEADFEDDKITRLYTLKKRKEAQEKELTKTLKSLPSEAKLLKQRQTCTDDYEKAAEKINNKRDRENKIRDSLATAHKELSSLEAISDGLKKRSQEYEHEITHIEDTDVCPECETEIDEDKKGELSAKYKEKLAKATDGIQKINDDIKVVEAKREKLEISLADFNKKGASEIADMEEQRSRISAIESQINDIKLEARKAALGEEGLESLEVEIERVRAETFTLDDMIDKETDKIKQAEESLKTAEQSWKRLEKHMERLEFWREGFGNAGIKSLLTEQVVPFLNDRAEQFSKLLTGGEVKITFKAQTQLKTGEFRERFGHDIELVGGGKDSCYDSTGGGFRRRTDLIIAFALRDLIMSQSKYKPNMTVYDECFSEVDETGCETLLSFLEEQADEIGTVFVITHNKKLAAQFQNTWRVTRDGTESTVEML